MKLTYATSNTSTPLINQKSQKISVVMGIISIVAVASAFYFGRSGLQDDLQTVRTNLREAELRLECVAGIETEQDVARLNNDIAYDDYVLALGAGTDPAVAHTAILVARDALVVVRDKRAQTLEICS